MKLYSKSNSYELYQGSMLDMLEVIEPNSIDSIITDPPYELNFMGKGWDNSGIAFQKETWEKCYQVLKPGGYLLAFGGSRTFHRIACAIEDAGFEIRDTIMWLYGSGFPKSMNIGLMLDKRLGVQGHRGKAIDVAGKGERKDIETNFKVIEPYNEYKSELGKKWQGWGTALKPSFEPIIVARKSFKGSLVDNVIEYGVGGINIDECRIPHNEKCKVMKKQSEINSIIQQSGRYEDTLELKPNGRFPANTILTYDDTDFDEVCSGFPDTKSNGGKTTMSDFSKYNGSMMNTTNLKERSARKESNYIAPCDSGSASRYFYCAKASKKDRNEGLDDFEDKVKVFNGKSNESSNDMKDVEKRFTTIAKNTHPTVKPTELMQYLVRLVSPNGATILDPFNGSGSTGKAAMYENKERNKNYKYIGIELTEEYLPIAKARIEYAIDSNIKVENEKKEDAPEGQLTIFDFEG